MVVNLWFANCPPCRRELADFATVDAEVGDRIRFVGVDPFDTVESMQRFASERGVDVDVVYEEWAAQTALRYLVPPEEVAGSVVFLASDLARPVTGQAIYTGAGQWFH